MDDKKRKVEIWKIILRNVISLVYCLAELSLGYKPENLTDRQK
jgi:hypothetical protein